MRIRTRSCCGGCASLQVLNPIKKNFFSVIEFSIIVDSIK